MLIFEFLNDKMHRKQNMTVNFIIQKLKMNTFSSKSIQTEKAEESLGARTLCFV